MNQVASDMPTLLAVWDHLVRADVHRPERLVGEARRAKSVLRPAAEASALDAAERRLASKLPSSYREFLMLSDGAYADPFGAMTESRAALPAAQTSCRGFGFLPVDEVTWLTEDIAPGLVSAYAQESDESLPLGNDGDLVRDLGPLRDRRVLVVTAVRESNLVGLVPTDSGEWQLWMFTRDEIRGFNSFRAWLIHATQAPGMTEVMDLVRWRRTRDPRGEALERVRDITTLPVLHAAIEEFADDEWLVCGVLRALGRIKNESSIPLIEPWVHRLGMRSFAVGALLRIGSPTAIDALVRQRAHAELWQLDDPRAGPVAVQALESGDLTAIGTLSNLADPAYLPVLRRAREQRVNSRADLGFAAAIFNCGGSEGAGYLRAIAMDDNYPEWQRQRAEAILRGEFPPAVPQGRSK